MKLIDCSTQKHPSLFAKVDDEDFEFINKFKWHTSRHGGLTYARRAAKVSEYRGKTIGMHRQIMGFPVGVQIDHKNGDGLDNRRSNLRICTSSENSKNRRPYGAVKFLGVTYHKEKKVFRAKITIDKRQKHLGTFTNAVDAAKAYNEAAVIHHGEFACLNLIPEQGA